MVSGDVLHELANGLYKEGKQNKAFELWNAAMEKGNSSAKYSVSECLRRGIAVPEKNSSLAMTYLKQVITLSISGS